MLVEYNIGSLSAEIKLSLMLSRSGKIANRNVLWQLTRIEGAKNSLQAQSEENLDDAAPNCEVEPNEENENEDKKIVHISDESRPTLSLIPGDYAICAHYMEKILDLGFVKLLQNTRTYATFILTDFVDAIDDDYFIDYDKNLEFSRRKQEREEQAQYGSAALPLRSPNRNNAEEGIQLETHPILLKAAQFNGISDDFSLEPSVNSDACRLTLEKNLEAQPKESPFSVPTPGNG